MTPPAAKHPNGVCNLSCPAIKEEILNKGVFSCRIKYQRTVPYEKRDEYGFNCTECQAEEIFHSAAPNQRIAEVIGDAIKELKEARSAESTEEIDDHIDATIGKLSALLLEAKDNARI